MSNELQKKDFPASHISNIQIYTNNKGALLRHPSTYNDVNLCQTELKIAVISRMSLSEFKAISISNIFQPVSE